MSADRENVGTRPTGRSHRRLALAVFGPILGLIAVALVLLFNPHALYERTHDIPNPYWGVFNGTFTYTPEQGPPSPALLDSRPEATALAYIHDYITVAGTYPCAQDLGQYHALAFGGNDPVLHGTACTVQRPVADVTVTSIFVGRVGKGIGAYSPAARVTYQMTYGDGEQWTDTLELLPERYRSYGLFSYVHQDCWDNLDLLLFYPKIVPDVPPHVAYQSPDFHLACQT